MLLEIITGDIYIDNSTRDDLTYLAQKTEFEGLEFIYLPRGKRQKYKEGEQVVFQNLPSYVSINNKWHSFDKGAIALKEIPRKTETFWS